MDFRASTQYGDWEGTASADGAHNSVHEYLTQKGLTNSSEFLIAVKFFVSENSTYVRAFVCDGDKYESVKEALEKTKGPVPVREIILNLSTGDFLKLFKRFDVVLTWHGLELGGREYSPK